MIDRADFLGLYRELGVEAGCTLDALRLAYRRRVAELHPDRAGGSAASEEQLKALNLGYEAALEFHRVHGRLPGEPVAPPQRSARPQHTATHAPPRHESPAAPDAEGDEEPGSSRRGLVLWLTILALMLLWWWSSSDAGSRGAHVEEIPAKPAPVAADSGSPLSVGASSSAVVALHGEPMSRGQEDQHWLYGPSWLQFHCDQLVDWYSSPLQPLKVGSARPSVAEEARADGMRHRQCTNTYMPAGRQ